MGLFKAERAAVISATETARDGINLTLVVSCAAILIAAAALTVALLS